MGTESHICSEWMESFSILYEIAKGKRRKKKKIETSHNNSSCDKKMVDASKLMVRYVSKVVF